MFLPQKNQGEKCHKRAAGDTEEDCNLSVEEVLMKDQEETEEIATTEVVNGGEPAGLYEGKILQEYLDEGEPVVVDEEWLGLPNTAKNNKLKMTFKGV